ncbi:MAG: penicillin-binding protein 2 [bacterium]|nr:penicillin-binding protein 2 [bacterium]
MSSRIGRVKALHWIVLAGWLALIARLIFMQVIDEAAYTAGARDNIMRQELLPTARGLIYDCRGRLLARNDAYLAIKAVPSEMREAGYYLAKLAKVLQLSKRETGEMLTLASVSPQDPQIFTKTLNKIMLAKIAEMQGETAGIYIEAKSSRTYPLGAVGAHVLGYVGEISEEELRKKRSQGYTAGELVGQDGVEYSQNTLLHGQAGRVISQVDVSGQPIRQIAEIAGYPGSNLYLSIDASLQRQCEALLQETLNKVYYKNGERSGGAIVAIEPDTGFVRALVSLPSYNPNWFSKGISTKRFNKLISDSRSPLLNRTISGAYPPGSTFKIVTTAAALQEGVINPHTWFYCPGVYYVEGLPFHCFVRTGHGGLNLTDCIAESCDVAYYSMGCKLGLKRLQSYANQFGLGERSGIELPGETEGIFPYPGWKEKAVNEKWFPGDNANTAIGQGFVAVTPLQVALYTMAAANGGTVYRPQIISSVESFSSEGKKVKNSLPQIWHRVPVKKSYFDDIKAGLRGTVSYGTASVLSYGIDMAGKTGTAENSPSADNPHGRNHTWFTGFAPVDNPKMVVTVFLEKSGGYGGNLAAPVAFAVVREWLSIEKQHYKGPVKAVEAWQ